MPRAVKAAKKPKPGKPKTAAPRWPDDAREAAINAALPASRTQFQQLLAAITGAKDE